MTSRFMLIFVAISGFVFVVLGAMEAHVFHRFLSTLELDWIQTALNYQAVHTLAILGLVAVMQRHMSLWFYWSGIFMALGTVLFSGSLYCLALAHSGPWVFMTPIGGVCFLVGWILMLIGVLRMKNKSVNNNE